MNHELKGIKGFSIRRPGRPAGSRKVDKNQPDLFQVEKVVSSITAAGRTPVKTLERK